MVKHIPAAPLFPDKLCQGPHQAQLRSLLSPRHHLSQLLAQGFSVAKHITSNPIQQKHRHRYKREHSRPRNEARDPRLGKSKQPFGGAESFLTAKPPRIFLGRLLGTHRPIAQQMPDAPSALSISLAASRHIQASRVAFAVTQSAKTSPPLIPPQPKMFELDPLAVATDLDVVFRANDAANSQFIEHSDQFDISKGPVRSQKQPASGHRMKRLSYECAHKVSFIAAAATFKRVLLVCPPVQRYGTAARAKRSNQKMLLILNRPVNAETKSADQRQLRNDNASRLPRQAIAIETRIRQKAGQTFAGSFKVIEETSQGGLTAASCGDQRQHEIGKSVALVAVCVFKDRVDILNQASGSRVLRHHNPILYRVYNSFPLAE